MQTRVERVQHPTRTTDTKVQLQVAVTVPGQGGDPVAKAQLQAVQRMGHLPRTRRQSLVGVAMDIALDPARHNLGVTMVPVSKINQRRDQQRVVLHQTEHGQLLKMEDSRDGWYCETSA